MRTLGDSKGNRRYLRALSIRQRYAELILRGEKKAEYRTIPTRIRERVYIYASRKPGPQKGWVKVDKEPDELPVGVLVGTVEIVGCVMNGDEYAWKLANPKRLRRLLTPENAPQPVWFRPFD
jgi:hypothetical protein